jgi:hypothetical protein
MEECPEQPRHALRRARNRRPGDHLLTHEVPDGPVHRAGRCQMQGSRSFPRDPPRGRELQTALQAGARNARNGLKWPGPRDGEAEPRSCGRGVGARTGRRVYRPSAFLAGEAARRRFVESALTGGYRSQAGARNTRNGLERNDLAMAKRNRDRAVGAWAPVPEEGLPLLVPTRRPGGDRSTSAATAGYRSTAFSVLGSGRGASLSSSATMSATASADCSISGRRRR